MQARFSHDLHRLSNYQCRAAIEARKVKEAPVLTFTNSVKSYLGVTSCYEIYPEKAMKLSDDRNDPAVIQFYCP
jgi:hypothetical protein